jgi:hypothetical protein
VQGLKIDGYSIYNLGTVRLQKKSHRVTVVRVSAEKGMLYIPISMIRKYVITSAPRHGNRFLKMPRRADLGQV